MFSFVNITPFLLGFIVVSDFVGIKFLEIEKIKVVPLSWTVTPRPRQLRKYLCIYHNKGTQTGNDEISLFSDRNTSLLSLLIYLQQKTQIARLNSSEV